VLNEIVIDTNVLLHAGNSQEQRQEACIQLIAALHECDCHLCVDNGFSFEEAKNRSLIGSEYLKHLRFGSLGYEIVTHLAKTQRIKNVPTKVPQQTAKHIRMQITSLQDRTYVKVAFNSTGKTLISHDFGDISDGARERLKTSIEVSIVDAETGCVFLMQSG